MLFWATMKMMENDTQHQFKPEILYAGSPDFGRTGRAKTAWLNTA
jgi:hypothetical protein